MRPSVEHHHTILLRTPKELLARTFGNALYQHLVSLPDATCIRFGRQTVLQSDNLVEAAYFYLFRHIVFKMLEAYVPGRSEYLNIKAAS